MLLGKLASYANSPLFELFAEPVLEAVDEITADINSFHMTKNAKEIKPREWGFFFRKNFDYDNGMTQIVDRYRDQQKKKIRKKVKKRAHRIMFAPLDSYCNSPRTRKYWEELRKGKNDEAIEDFLKYIEEVEC